MPYKDPERQKQYQRERAARLRREWLEANGPCGKCGSRERLEADHIDPATKVGHSVWSWTPARRTAELAKCQVLCRDCHWDKTKADFGWGEYSDHGTKGRRKSGCRCADCRAWVTADRAERRARAAEAA